MVPLPLRWGFDVTYNATALEATIAAVKAASPYTSKPDQCPSYGARTPWFELNTTADVKVGTAKGASAFQPTAAPNEPPTAASPQPTLKPPAASRQPTSSPVLQPTGSSSSSYSYSYGAAPKPPAASPEPTRSPVPQPTDSSSRGARGGGGARAASAAVARLGDRR